MKNSILYSFFFLLTVVPFTLIHATQASTTPEEIDYLITTAVERNVNEEVIYLDTLVIQKIIRLSKETQYRFGFIKANKILGEFYERNDLAFQAIRYYQLSLEELKAGADYFFIRMEILYSIGHCYFTLGRFQEAIEIQTAFLEEVDQELAKENYDKNKLLIKRNIALMSLANLQINQGKYEDGLKNQLAAYQHTTLALYQEDTLKYRYNKTTNAFNLGYTYLMLGEGKKARLYLEEFHDHVLQQGKDSKDLATSFGNLAYCEYLIKNFDTAYNYYQKSLALSIKHGYAEVTSITYKDLSDTYRADGNLAKAIDYLDKHYALKDSLEGMQIQADLNSLKVEHENVIQEQEIIRLNQQNQIQWQKTLLYIGGLIAFGLLSLLVIGYLVLQNKRRKEQSEMQDLKLMNAQQELVHKQQDVVQLALQISKRQEFSDKLLKQLQHFAKYKQPNIQKDWHKFERKLRDSLQPSEEQKMLNKNIDAINHAFYAKLNERFPNLSPTDKELCSFLRLGLSNKEIAALRGVTPEAIRSSRFRLRKRLEMDSKANVVLFLQEL